MAKKKRAKTVSMTAYAALTTYSDLLSLLLTLFVLLYALSEPKRPRLEATLSSIRQHMQRLPPPPPPRPSVTPRRTSEEDLGVLRRGPPGRRNEVASIVEDERQKLVVGGEGLFERGSSLLSGKAKHMIQSDIAPDLRGFRNRIEIVGHADGEEGDIIDPWVLGSSRAAAVMRFLVDECGLEEERFRISSCGAIEPRDANNPAANRRVEIIMTEYLVK